MKKLGLKMNIAGWIVFAISFLVEGIPHSYISGIACGLFIASVWVNIYEYKNQ
jgi:hypothetical protein